jgi:hypothetical protein
MKIFCEKCSASKNGGFIIKLRSESTVGLFGASVPGNTFYAKVLTEVKLGAESVLNLSEWTIVERPFVTEEGETIQLKWLKSK